MSGSKRARTLQRREFLRISGGALMLAAGGGALAGCTGGRNDAFSNLPASGGQPGTGGQQTRVLVAQTPLTVGMDRGQNVAQVATLQNVQGRNYQVFAVPDAGGLPQRIVQTIAWENDPNQYTRTIFDEQSRPAQVVYSAADYFATLTWSSDNTAVTLRTYNDTGSAPALLGGATVRRQGDNYVVEPLGSAAATGRAAATPLASVSAQQVSRFVADAFGLDVLDGLIDLINPYFLLLAALVLLLGQGSLTSLLAPSQPSIGALLVSFLIVALFVGEAFGTSRDLLARGSAVAGVIGAASTLYLAHVFDPASGFYMTDAGGNTGGGSTGGGTGTVQVGTITFSNVANTNANTTTITNTSAGASFSNNVLNASLTQSGSQTVVRVLSIQIGATDLASVTVGKTYPIQTASGSPANGNAVVSYIEQQGANSKFWFATGGSVVVDARSGNTITLRVVNATMRAQNNAGSTTQPTGTFTINAAGQFTVR
jgi:hypothetical protein